MSTAALQPACAVPEATPYPDVLCNRCNYLRTLIARREAELRDLHCEYEDILVEYLRMIAKTGKATS